MTTPSEAAVTDDELPTDTTESTEQQSVGEAPPEDGQPSYDDLAAERDHWKAMAEAAGAGKAGAEAAKYRTQLRSVESDLAEAQEALAAANAVLFTIAAERAQVQPDLMTARGIEAAQFVDGDGVVQLDHLVEAMQAERDQLGLPRKPAANPVAGRSSGPTPELTGKAAWDAAFGVRH